MSWAAICKKANSGKHAGKNVNEINRFDEVLAKIKSAIGELQRKNPNLFLRLDYYTRLRIFDMVIEPLRGPIHLKGRRTGKLISFPVPPLARAFNNCIRNECLMLLLEKSVIEIHSGPGLMKLRSFLYGVDFNEFGNKNTSYNFGYDCIKVLNFPFFSRFPHQTLETGAFNQDIMLMRACKNLVSVELSLVDEELIKYDDDSGVMVKKPMAQLRKEYRLDDMLVLPKLKSLYVQSRDTERVWRHYHDIGYQVAEELGKWFVDEFAKRGKAVEVTVT